MTSELSAIVLAAGEGSRMRSTLPKPLHRICGRPMVLHVIDALVELGVDRIVVVIGHAADEVRHAIEAEAPPGSRIEFAVQPEQHGTGDAVAVGLTALPVGSIDDVEDLLVVPGDTPLLRAASLGDLVALHRAEDAGVTLLTARLADPSGYGRVVRTPTGSVVGIVEHADATLEQRAIDEINTSIYCFSRGPLAPALRRLSPQNAQGEYYLTDVVSVVHDAGYPTTALELADPLEASGVNDRVQLAEAEAVMRRRINAGWMAQGVTMRDPAATYVDIDVVIDPDVILLPGVALLSGTTVGRGSMVGPDCHLESCVVGERAEVRSTTASGASIGDGARVGPFVHLEAGTVVASGVHLAGPPAVDA